MQSQALGGQHVQLWVALQFFIFRLGSCRSTIELRPQTHVFWFLAPIWLPYNLTGFGELQSLPDTLNSRAATSCYELLRPGGGRATSLGRNASSPRL